MSKQPLSPDIEPNPVQTDPFPPFDTPAEADEFVHWLAEDE